MLRFMTPYLLLATVLTVVGGAAYGSGSISVPVLYGIAFVAVLVGGIGYARWDAIRHPHQR